MPDDLSGLLPEVERHLGRCGCEALAAPPGSKPVAAVEAPRARSLLPLRERARFALRRHLGILRRGHLVFRCMALLHGSFLAAVLLRGGGRPWPLAWFLLWDLVLVYLDGWKREKRAIRDHAFHIETRLMVQRALASDVEAGLIRREVLAELVNTCPCGCQTTGMVALTDSTAGAR